MTQIQSPRLCLAIRPASALFAADSRRAPAAGRRMRSTLALHGRRVRLLGELEVEATGKPLERIASHRARSLLAWLAVNPGLHPRARVASVFWPDVLDESARASLRTTLATLRRELGPAGADIVTATRERVGIEPGPELSIDLCAFEDLASRGQLEEAAALCHGELGGPGRRLGVRRAGEPSPPEAGCTRSVGGERGKFRGPPLSTRPHPGPGGLDPLSEAAQGGLIRRLATAGDRAGALAAYKAYGARLRRDLGIAPSAGIRELAEGVRGGRRSRPATGWAPVPPRGPRDPTRS